MDRKEKPYERDTDQHHSLLPSTRYACFNNIPTVLQNGPNLSTAAGGASHKIGPPAKNGRSMGIQQL